MTGYELINCRQADILTCDADSLIDLKDVSICADLPLPQRTEQYLEQIQNPYLFRVDRLIVKASFTGDRNLSSVLADLFAQS